MNASTGKLLGVKYMEDVVLNVTLVLIHASTQTPGEERFRNKNHQTWPTMQDIPYSHVRRDVCGVVLTHSFVWQCNFTDIYIYILRYNVLLKYSFTIWRKAMKTTENTSFPRTCCKKSCLNVCSCNKSDLVGLYQGQKASQMLQIQDKDFEVRLKNRPTKTSCSNGFPWHLWVFNGFFNMQQHLIFEHFLDVEKLLRCLRSDSLCFKFCKSIACCVLTLLEFPWHVISRVISKMGSEYKEIQEVKLCLIYSLYSFVKCIERWSA